MAYAEEWFEDIPDEYEDFFESFSEVWIHQDVRNSGEQPRMTSRGRGKLFIYCDNMNGAFRYPSQVTVNVEDLSWDGSLETEPHAFQTDLYTGSGFMTKVKDNNGRIIMQVDPIMRFYVTSDIFHEVNEYTDEILDLLMWIDSHPQEFMRCIDTVDTERNLESGLDGSTLMVDGEMYRMEQTGAVNKDEFMTPVYKNIDYLIEHLDKRFDEIYFERDDTVGITSSEMSRLRSAGITCYSLRDEGKLVCYRNIGYHLRYLASRNVPMKVELPPEYQHEKTGHIQIKLKSLESSNTRFPMNIQNVRVDVVHPHSSASVDGEFANYCNGNINLGRPSDVSEIIKAFDDVERSLETLNASSMLSGHQGEGGSFYSRLHEDIYENQED